MSGKYSVNGTGVTEPNFTNRILNMEERISRIEDKIKEMIHWSK